MFSVLYSCALFLATYASAHVFTSKEVKLLSSLNVLVYPDPLDVGRGMLGVYSKGDGIYQKLENEKSRITNITKDIFNNLSSKPYNLTDHLLGKSTKYTNESRLLHDSDTEVGSNWINYEDDDYDIVVFRGTWSTADKMNYLTHAKYWIFENVQTYSYKLYDDYYKSIGKKLPEEIKLDARDPTFIYEDLIARIGVYFMLKYDNPLLKLSHDDKQYIESLFTIEEWENFGYGLLIKNVVDEKLSTLNKQKQKQLIFTGHSQGGYLSQLASLYATTKGKKIPTLTFNAVGVKCNGRLDELLGIKTLTSSQTSHIVNIKDKLDIYVSFDQTVGTSCYYDNQYFNMTSKYCNSVVGQNGYNVEGGDLAAQFSQCRYFTHSIWRVHEAITSQVPLNCTYRDETVSCPDKNPTDTIAVGVTTAVVIGIFLILMCCGLVYCCCKKKKVAHLHTVSIDPASIAMMKINPYKA